MDCTEAQYNEFLKEPLLKMGYKFASHFDCNNKIIVNDYCQAIGNIGIIALTARKNGGRQYLGAFNAPLFLARAAMNDNKYGRYGEYWTFVGGEKKGFTKGDIYRCVDLIPSPTFINDVGIKVNFIGWELFFSMFRKSTTEEIEQFLGLTSLVSSIKKRNDDIPREEEDAIMLLKDRKYRIFKEEINLREV